MTNALDTGAGQDLAGTGDLGGRASPPRMRPGPDRLRPSAGSSARRAGRWIGWVYVAPAMAFYAYLVLQPLVRSVQYSVYRWDGIGKATFVGFDNYVQVFSDPDRLGVVLNAFKFIVFYTFLSTGVGLLAAVLTRRLSSRLAGAARTILFLPQVVPLVGAGIAWSWLYSERGVINQLLRAVGMDGLARPWLADFDTALPAVGFVGTWVLVGLCTMLLTSGMSKIDLALYDAARVDGAGPIRELLAVTIPGIRAELTVCLTITMIAALASFDVVYVMTLGGPGRATMVPGVEVYQLAFAQARIGAASAMGVVLMALVLLVVLPLQRFMRERT